MSGESRKGKGKQPMAPVEDEECGAPQLCARGRAQSAVRSVASRWCISDA
jgi:hypothetical protein